ncbi:MAG: PQQ-binding-like beta-propeller repeat protein, partial [Candidatus Limnocylindrales bacterium]
MKSLASAVVHSGAGPKTSRRSSVRLLRLAPAAVLLCGLFTVWAGPLAAPVAAASGDWTQFHNGAAHQGYNTAETTLSASNVHALGVAWSGATGGVITYYSSPAVANGVVYVGSGDDKLYAYAVGCAGGGGTCTPLWTGTTGGAISSSPAVANGVVYVGSTDDKLYAYAVGCAGGGGTCTPLWTATTGSYVVSSPAVSNGVVYVGSYDGKLYAYAVGCAGGGGTCTPLWTATTGGAIFSSPAVANGVVYVGSDDGKLYAYLVGCASGGGTCTPLWTATTGSHISSSPAATNGVVYVGSADHKLYAYAVGCAGGGGTCTPLWTATTGGGVYSSPAVANGVVYVGSDDGKLYAYAVGCNSGGGTCTPLWTATTGRTILSSPAVANGVVYVGSWDQKLYAFAVGCASGGGTCTPLWTYITGGAIDSSPAVSDGVVYVGSSDRKLYAFVLPLDHLILSPSSATIVAGGSQTYTAEGSDIHGNSLGDVTGLTTFTISGSASCTANSCTPTAAGDHTVTGTDGTATGTATLHVNAGTLDHLVLTPSVSTITAGGSQAYTAEGYDSSNNSLGDVTGATTFTISGSGSCTLASCTTNVAVDHTVTGTDGTATGTATLHVNAGTLDHLVLTPSVSTITAGGSQAYTAEGFDVYGNSWDDTSSTTFTISGSGSCTGAACTSTVAGDHTITGSDSGVYGTATLHVNAGPLDHLVLSPASATIDPGATQVFLATGYDAFNNSLGDVTSATTLGIAGGGSCDNTAHTCTSTVAGDHTVTGTDGTATGTATLHVTGVLGVASGATYHALTPARILDSRDGTGGLAGPFSSHVARTFTVIGHGGVPAGAIAVTGNLTVTQQTSGGFLSIGPDAQNNPTSSTLNFPLGDDRANAVTVALGAGGTLSITYAAPIFGPTAYVIFDVTGYFTPDITGATYHALTPSRILDSRDGTGGLAGPFSSHVARTFTVIGHGGVPAGAIAVTGNLTVTQQTSGGFLSIGPDPQNNPTSSTLNFPLGDDRANAVTVALSGSGTLSITYAAPIFGPTAHVIFDVTGYFTPDITGATYHALTPARILDSRDHTGGLGIFSSHVAQTFQVTGRGGVAADAIA